MNSIENTLNSGPGHFSTRDFSYPVRTPLGGTSGVLFWADHTNGAAAEEPSPTSMAAPGPPAFETPMIWNWSSCEGQREAAGRGEPRRFSINPDAELSANDRPAFRLHCTHDLRECRPWSFRIRRVGMDEAIARENIRHFRKLLETEADEAKRKTIMQLLTEEEVKLATATDRKKRR